MTINDFTALLTAIAISVTALVGVANLLQARANAKQGAATHQLVDGKMTQLLASTEAIGVANTATAKAEGINEGAQSQRDRDAPGIQPPEPPA